MYSRRVSLLHKATLKGPKSKRDPPIFFKKQKAGAPSHTAALIGILADVHRVPIKRQKLSLLSKTRPRAPPDESRNQGGADFSR